MYSGARTQEHYAFALVCIARGELANIRGVSRLMLFNLESQKLVRIPGDGDQRFRTVYYSDFV